MLVRGFHLPAVVDLRTVRHRFVGDVVVPPKELPGTATTAQRGGSKTE